MAYYNTTFLGYLTSGNIYVASSGLTNVVFKAQPSESIVSSATEVAVGLYQWLVPDTSYAYKLYVNGNVVSNWGGPTGRFVPTTDLATISYVDIEIAGRVHREGDTLLGPYYLTYAPTGNGMNVIEMTGGNVSNSAVPTKGYVDNRILSLSSLTSGLTALTGQYLPLSGGQLNGNVTGNYTQHTWVATKILGSSASADYASLTADKALIEQGALTVYNNLGIVPAGDMFKLYYLNTDAETVNLLTAGHNSNEQPYIDFKGTALTGTGRIACAEAAINTNATKYILGNPANNDFVWKKWVTDNFQTISDDFQSNTVIVDSKVEENVNLKLYSTITTAISEIIASGGGGTSTDIWTLKVRQHHSLTGYGENVEVPDYFNIVGEGQVLIAGQLTRSSTGTVINSKLENLHFTVANSAQNVERFEAVNCIFTSTSDGDIDIERSIVRNCGFYANNVQSSNNNKVFNCFGNQNIVWQANDKVYSYDFITGESYN